MILNKVKCCASGYYLGVMATMLLLVGCSLADSDNSNSITTVSDPELAVTRVMVDIEPVPVSLVEETPAPAPIAVEVIPDGFRKLGETDQCIRPCMYGIELGQTMEEVIQAIRDNPQTDTTRIFQDGDYIRIYPTSNIDEDKSKGIEWQIKVDKTDRYSDFLFPGQGTVFTRDNYVYLNVIDPTNVIPLSLIIEEYGKPRYILTDYLGSTKVSFHLIYLLPDAAYLKFRVDGRGSPPMLSEYSLVESVSIGELDFLLDVVCRPLYGNTIQEWQGFGGLDIYYDREGERIGTIPFDC